jgi:NDP-sugar pyrophosphorylase family protein
MKSMLFAAGLGTRLRPLTNDRPKAMVELKGKPLLQWSIERLIAAGSREIIVNVHHYADMIIDFIKSNNSFGVRIEISDEREQLLETGGGLKKAQWFFDDGAPFLVVNVDILTNMDLGKLYETHLETNPLATLAVTDRTTSRYFLFDQKMHLSGWTNIKTSETRPSDLNKTNLSQLAFSGIHVLSPRIFDYMLEDDKFSIVEVYLRAMEKETIIGYRHDGDIWIDVGKPASLEMAEKSQLFEK